MGILIFGQNLGCAVMLVVAETIYGNSMRSEINIYAPGISPDSILGAGARSIRNLVSGEQLAGVLQAYSRSIDHVFHLCIGIPTLSSSIALCMGWKDVRRGNGQKAIEA